MKLIITESQFRNIINEETIGIDGFINQLSEKYPEIKDHEEYLKTEIMGSGVKNISFRNLSNGVSGISLHDRVIINESMLSKELPDILYVIFHELGHQYQYRKYGKEKMYSSFTDNSSIIRAIDWLRETELVADEYGMRKTRELFNKGVIKSNVKHKKGLYSSYNDDMFYNYIKRIKKIIGDVEGKTPDQISELLFNWITNDVPLNKKEG